METFRPTTTSAGNRIFGYKEEKPWEKKTVELPGLFGQQL